MTAAASPAFVPPDVAPGPRYRTIFGWFRDFRRDPLRFLEDCARVYGPVAVFRAPPATGFVVSDPELIRELLERRSDRYWKGDVMLRIAEYTGAGILFSDGERWRANRRAAQPAFRSDRLKAMGGAMARGGQALVERWRAEGREAGDAFDVAPEMAKTALDIAARALFWTDLSDKLEDYSVLVTRLLERASHLMNHAITAPLWLPTPRNRKARADMRYISDEIDALIAERDRAERGEDLLSFLLAARDDPSQEHMTAEQVRAECVTFLGAGHETTGGALAWAWYLLAANPEAERRFHEEIDGVLGGRAPGIEDIPALEYTRRVVDETLRLYPPAWAFARQAHGGDEIAGHVVSKGAPIFFSPWVMHRHPDYWDEPERFDPDRFLPERSRDRPRYAYFPFGGGPRRCVGDQFALLEIPLVLAAVAQHYRLRLVPGHVVEPFPIFTLRARNGIRVTLEARRP